ncbi:MAG: hypothetical protein RL653_2979 [Pseudomonadota bacterium]|jgi:hypothetical protein
MGRLFALLFLAAASSAGAGTLEERLDECREAHADCKEDCTTSYGTQSKLREKLGLCLNKCTRRNDDCRGRHVELDQAGIDEDTFDRKRPVDEATLPRKRAPADVPSVPRRRSEQAEAPARGDAEDASPAPSPSDGDKEPPARTQAREERPAARPEPVREERASSGPSSPPGPTAERSSPEADPEGAAQEGASAPKQEDEDAARAGAKKLMKKGIEEWDPSGE